MFTYHTFADRSERVVDICEGTDIETFTDPANPTIATVNWTTEGYSNNDLLDGKDNTLRSLTFSAINQKTGEPVTIWQNGLQVAALRVPFLFKSVAPQMALFIYNVPRQPELVYDVYIISTTPNGLDTVLEQWTVRIKGM